MPAQPAQRSALGDALWLSAPPYLFFARVHELDESSTPPRVRYEILDRDGSVLLGDLVGSFDATWHRCFQRLTRRWG